MSEDQAMAELQRACDEIVTDNVDRAIELLQEVIEQVRVMPAPFVTAAMANLRDAASAALLVVRGLRR